MNRINNVNTIYVDFDNTIINTISTIVKLYCEDFKYYKDFRLVHWTEIKSWDFRELRCASKEYINTYFNQQRFFDNIEWMPWAKETLDKLYEKYKIVIVSSGYSPNLKAKELWIKQHIPYARFIGVNLKEHKDKSEIDMSDGIFIDDSRNNLFTSNALINVCFGDKYEWNEEWEGYRAYNWFDIRKLLLND